MPVDVDAEIDRLRQKLLDRKTAEQPLVNGDFLSTGSTLLNLACSGRADGGFLKGRYFFLVGDSASGKSFLSLTCLAEATKNPAFANYRLIYDDVEGGALMDVERFFGKKLAGCLEPPAVGKDGEARHSTTVEEFFDHVDDAFAADKPFIYVLDSMDGLSSEEESEKFAEQKKARRSGKEAAGSYGTSKAKANSAGIRQVIPKLRATGSILIVVSQTRDNLGFGFEKKTRSGGHALRFYAAIEMWASIAGKIRKTVQGEQEQQGITCRVQVKKNRINGKEREIAFPIFWSVGIDDTGGMVQWLIDRKHWVKDGQSVKAPEFTHKGTFEALVKKIEEGDKEEELKSIVAKVWADIENQLEVRRKPRYF